MFHNRQHAGTLLAEKLSGMALINPLVLAIPRGGVIVAGPVAEQMRCGIRILVVRKIGHPMNPEVAIGAVMPDGTPILDQAMVRYWGISQQQVDTVIRQEFAELERRARHYPALIRAEDLGGATVIIVDDGIATGYTMKAAITWLKSFAPRIIIAVPVAPPDVIRDLSEFADQVVCLIQPEHFWAVGAFYEDFSQTTDTEALAILKQHDNC